MEINTVRNIGTHQTHCCIRHGCKYGNANCPVVNETVVQAYACEYCEETKPWIITRVSVSEEVFTECKNITRNYFIFDNIKYSFELGQVIEFSTSSMKTTFKRFLAKVSEDKELPPNLSIATLIPEDYYD